jgi:hypothetical protein
VRVRGQVGVRASVVCVCPRACASFALVVLSGGEKAEHEVDDMIWDVFFFYPELGPPLTPLRPEVYVVLYMNQRNVIEKRKNNCLSRLDVLYFWGRPLRRQMVGSFVWTSLRHA